MQASIRPSPAFIRAMLFHVIRTGLGVYGLDQDLLALVRQALDVRLEAVPDLASAGLPLGTSPWHPSSKRLLILPRPWKMGATTWRARKRELVIVIRVVM